MVTGYRTTRRHELLEHVLPEHVQGNDAPTVHEGNTNQERVNVNQKREALHAAKSSSHRQVASVG